MEYSAHDKELLEHFAHYVWWEDKEYIINENPLRIVASAMKYANCKQSFEKLCEFSEPVLKEALKNAQPGWFDNINWNFWHIWLYGANVTIPPLPKRGYLK